MRARLLRLANWLRESYWFIPAIMALGAMVLAALMILLDSHEGSKWMDGVPWLYAARPDGARQVLSAIGGSMITVAGTVFSVTIAAVVYASGQYGPRLLSNFMSDKGNKFTLGTFIATFLYCLLVLRTIRSAEESGGYSFVPNLALLVAVVLAICSIAMLIYFIHHVPSTIHINSVIEDIGDRLLKEIEDRFPTFVGDAPAKDAPPDVPATFRRDSGEKTAHERCQISADATGYIQIIDDDGLMDIARRHGLVLRLQYQPGDFVHVGRTLVEAHPPDCCDKAARAAIQDAFGVGSRRAAFQDLRFLIDELVEIAARALSPGVNDPFTAVTCLDWLGAAIGNLATRELPSHLRVDKAGALRVIAHPVTFERLLDRSFGALAQYAAGDMVAALRFLGSLGDVAMACDEPGRLASIRAMSLMLETLAAEKLHGPNLARVRERGAELRKALSQPDYRRQLRDSTAWLGGTA